MSKGAIGMGIGCLVLGVFFAPAIAAAAGTMGILGAAGTGTAIGTLSGAALTSASLAAIGGSVLSGTVMIGSLSGVGGACVAAYCSSLEKGKVEEASNHLKNFAKADRKEFLKTFHAYKDDMAPEERAIWEKYV